MTLPKRPLLTFPQLAERLSVGEKALRERARKGLIPGLVKLGRTVRFDPDVIDEWIAASQQTTLVDGKVESVG